MAGTIRSIEEYLRSCHGIMRVPLAYVIRKTITVQTYGDYLKYVTTDEKVIARMLALSMTSWIRSAKILIYIHKSNSISPRRMAKGRFMPSTTASEAKLVLQIFTYDTNDKAWNWEKYVA